MVYYTGTVRPSLMIRLLRRGCTNRPFYHIIVIETEKRSIFDGIEQLGVYDPMPNERNEELMSLNVERFQYWLAKGAKPNCNVSMLLGLAGILPVHPHSLRLALKTREDRIKEAAAKEQNEATAAQ